MNAIPEIDKERQRKAKEYARLGRRVFVADLAISAAFLLFLLWFDLPGRLRFAATGEPYLAVAVYFVFILLAYRLLLLPLSYYSGFILPHRFDLSTQSRGGWAKDVLKGTGLSLVFGLVVVEVVYFLLATFPATWWLWAAGFVLAVTVVLANLAPVLLLPLFYKFRPLEDRDLANRLERLAERAGTRVRGVYTMDLSSRTKAANAALMGLGNTRRIVLGDTLLEHYPPDEIEVVLAHELGHHAHGDILKGIAADTAITLLSFWLADLALRAAAGYLGLASIADPAGLPVLALVVGVVGIVSMPLTNGFTRWMEAQADRYALESTGKARAFLGAMTRLANQNLSETDPPRWVEVLLYDHPPIGKRLALARQYLRGEDRKAA